MTHESGDTIPPERHENAHFINNKPRTARGWWRNTWVEMDDWRNMVNRRLIAAAFALLTLAGCAGTWEVAYDDPPDRDVTKTWRVVDVVAVAPQTLTVSNDNTFLPQADIVWHGDPFGDRRAQVAAILDEGLTKGARGLRGTRPVTITARIITFHGVTPAAVARAPAAVHNIRFVMRVFDARTGEPLTESEVISADLEANVGIAAVAAAINRQTQRQRVVDHLAAVTRGWFGFGPDQRREFYSIGR